jgi:hypothetical protein
LAAGRDLEFDRELFLRSVAYRCVSRLSVARPPSAHEPCLEKEASLTAGERPRTQGHRAAGCCYPMDNSCAVSH